ncbi:MAG: protein-glutamate O-methyltransferase CheR [Nitrospirae bacterium]|nr:protein-glutamate O-methyltransferase CheR [Nitrospirota bacterium]
MALDDSKTYLIETRLDPIARQEGFPSINDLGRHMKQHPSQPLRQKVIDAMMTNETSFFRDVKPFELLKGVVIPDLLKANEKGRRIRIWTAGCSTGQEPYTISMLLCEMGPALRQWDIGILATDIADGALARAKAGIYSQYEVQRGLPVTYLTRFFNQRKTEWEIKQEVKRLVEFRRLNLLSGFSHLGIFDVIFCRNVLIYFDADTKVRIMEQFADILSSGGVFFLGGAETPFGITGKFTRIETEKGVCYKKNTIPMQP